jgi:hypothetical protein
MSNIKQKVILILVVLYSAFQIYSVYYTYQFGIDTGGHMEEFVRNEVNFLELWHWGVNLALLIVAAVFFVWRHKAAISIFGMLLVSVLLSMS